MVRKHTAGLKKRCLTYQKVEAIYYPYYYLGCELEIENYRQTHPQHKRERRKSKIINIRVLIESICCQVSGLKAKLNTDSYKLQPVNHSEDYFSAFW